MSRPGFYNDNEYRAYPFIYTAAVGETLPNSLIVDAGIIAGLDAEFDETQHTVWLHSVSRAGDTITFTFYTNAPAAAGVPLIFSRSISAESWEIEYAETTADAEVCASEPLLEGFLVTGDVAGFAQTLSNGATVTLADNAYQLEPARIQNLAKSYLRSINIGNYERTAVPVCGETNSTTRSVVLNTRCMSGDIRFMAGYYCDLTQTDVINQINVSAGQTAGLSADADLCDNGGEVPFFEGEPKPAGSLFYGGGPACSEVISSINGIEGSAVNLSAGAGVQITTAENKITVALNSNSQNSCAPIGG
jgi:hypothetical protein